MRDLDKALADITAIRAQMARGTEFQGYGPITVAATGVLALAAAAAQAILIPDPAAAVFSYLALWVATAAVSVILIAIEMVARSQRIHTGLADEMIHTPTEQFIPAGVAGTRLTVVLYRAGLWRVVLYGVGLDVLWMLPGLWQIIFSLGFFATCRTLPRAMFAVGVWYLAAGLASLAFANGEQAFSPWAMALPFGLGQLMMAGILYRSGISDAET